MPDLRCETCVWWHRNGPPLAAATRKVGATEDLGTCQARPPSVVQNPHLAVSLFPETHASRFCGDWMDDWTSGDGGEKVTQLGSGVQLRSVA